MPRVMARVMARTRTMARAKSLWLGLKVYGYDYG